MTDEEEPKIIRINIGESSWEKLQLFSGCGLYYTERPTAQMIIQKLQEIIEKYPDLTIRADVESHGGEFPFGSVFVYGERLETPEEVEKRIARRKSDAEYELRQAKEKYEGLLRYQQTR